MSRTRPRRDWTRARWKQHKKGVTSLNNAFGGITAITAFLDERGTKKPRTRPTRRRIAKKYGDD